MRLKNIDMAPGKLYRNTLRSNKVTNLIDCHTSEYLSSKIIKVSTSSTILSGNHATFGRTSTIHA